ncbi:MAG TPA: OmpA family protein, partial [Kofleriaceae bacterium]
LRRRRRAAAVLVVAAVLPRLAGAQVMEPANFGVERFQLSSDRDGMFDVEWAEVQGDMAISAALWAGLANDPLVLYRGQPGARVGSLVADRAGGGLGASISPNRWLQLGFDLPLVIYQDRPGASALGAMESLRSFGTGNLRVIPKLVLLQQADHGVGLAVIPSVILPTRSTSDSYVDDRGFGFAPELVLSRRWTGWRTSVEAGYHARQRATFLNQVVDDELFARAGLGYQFADRGGPPVGIDLTMSGATAARAPLQNVNENHLEGLIGATYDLPGDTRLFAGAGMGLRKGYGTPDWRGLAGVRMGFGSVQRTAPPPPAPEPIYVPPPAPDPMPPSPVTPSPEPPIEIGEVYFAFDRAEIEPGSIAVLDKVVAAFRADDQLKLEVEGHADSQGDETYNKKLSQRRADTVLKYLVGRGIAVDRLTTIGLGEGRPLADNSTPDGRAHNRCVAFRILRGGDHVKTDVQGAAGDAK